MRSLMCLLANLLISQFFAASALPDDVQRPVKPDAIKLFNTLCLEPENNISKIVEGVEAAGFVQVPRARLDGYYKGIEPHLRVVYQHPEQTSLYIVVEAAGEITSEMRKKYSNGFSVRSAPIMPDVRITDVLGQGVTNKIGGVRCEVIDVQVDETMLESDVEALRLTNGHLVGDLRFKVTKLHIVDGVEVPVTHWHGTIRNAGPDIYNVMFSKEKKILRLNSGFGVHVGDPPETYEIQ